MGQRLPHPSGDHPERCIELEILVERDQFLPSGKSPPPPFLCLDGEEDHGGNHKGDSEFRWAEGFGLEDAVEDRQVDGGQLQKKRQRHDNQERFV